MLVVDDNSVNRSILARQLELAGAASTDTAAGGEEALELWRRGHYDLVLADLQMPSMDGFELSRRIRAREREPSGCSARPSSPSPPARSRTTSSRTREVGMDGLITKPVGIEQLRATLDVWLKDAARMKDARRALKAYDRDKLVELFGNDPAHDGRGRARVLDTARDVDARDRRDRRCSRRSPARRTG